jgi:transcriptional regulator with XRE-family HTH domain
MTSRRADSHSRHPVPLADRIALVRLRLGLSQPQFATRIGLHRNSVMRYERGQTTPRTATLRRIARATGLTVEQLVDGDGTRWGSQVAWSEPVALLRTVWRDPGRRALALRTLRALV